jgi:hypothetical protein
MFIVNLTTLLLAGTVANSHQKSSSKRSEHAVRRSDSDTEFLAQGPASAKDGYWSAARRDAKLDELAYFAFVERAVTSFSII